VRAVVQRVSSARVEVDGEVTGAIGRGLLVLLGVGQGDTDKQAAWLAEKITGLRIFEDDEGKMNRSVTDVGGEVLVISQFTLFGDVRRGMRPYFGEAAVPEKGNDFYERFIRLLEENDVPVKAGVFGAHMLVDILNDGPVTVSLDTRTM